MASEASGLPFPTITLAGGSTIFRVHRVGKRPVFFGPRPGSPPGSRFDAPGGQYRTLYAAERLDGAVAETLLREPAKRLIRLSDIADRAWVGLRVTRPLLLVKLMDEGLRWHGVDASISASAGYRKPRSLALSFIAAIQCSTGLPTGRGTAAGSSVFPSSTACNPAISTPDRPAA